MGRKLLVADDSVTIQKVIKLALSSEGYDILAVSEGKEAIRAIQEERPDVVLIDVTLPGADAYAVKRAINANPQLASTGFILMLSAFERVDENLIAEVKFQGRLIKPFDPSHLRKAVSELLAGGGSAASRGASAEPPAPPAESASPDEDSIDLTPSRPGPALVAPPVPPEPMADDDLPPVRDMHPTVEEEPAAQAMTEEEFQMESPVEVTRTSMTIPQPTPPGPEEHEPSMKIAAPPPPPPIATAEDRTDPNFMLPPEAKPDAAPEAPAESDAEMARALENDIKDLTESTIKMSGLDEFNWNLDDSKKMKAPVSAPPAAPAPPDFPKPESSSPIGADKKAAIIKSLNTAGARPLDDGGSSFPLSTAKPKAPAAASSPAAPPRPAPTAPAAERPQPAPRRPEAPPAPPAASATLLSKPAGPPSGDYVSPTIDIRPPAPAAPASPISRAEIEALIRKDVEAAIEKLAREAVPRIAEAIIRKEIEKILAET